MCEVVVRIRQAFIYVQVNPLFVCVVSSLSRSRLKTIDAKLQLVDQQVEEFREKQRLARQKRRLSRQILAPAPVRLTRPNNYHSSSLAIILTPIIPASIETLILTFSTWQNNLMENVLVHPIQFNNLHTWFYVDERIKISIVLLSGLPATTAGDSII